MKLLTQQIEKDAGPNVRKHLVKVLKQKITEKVDLVSIVKAAEAVLDGKDLDNNVNNDDLKQVTAMDIREEEKRTVRKIHHVDLLDLGQCRENERIEPIMRKPHQLCGKIHQNGNCSYK